MTRRRLWILGFLALGSLTCAACSGDDIELAPHDAGVHDATIPSLDAPSAEAAVDARVDSGCAVYDASALDPSLVAAGKALVTANKCQQCHGGNLAGNNDGVMVPGGGQAYPPNLTNDQTTGLGCWSNQQIANAILDGVDDQGMPLCPPMPLFGDAGVTTAQADEIVEYLRSLMVEKNQVPDTTCSPAADAAVDAPPVDAGTDAAPTDASLDSPADAGVDAPAVDSGVDATVDAGVDSGIDAGIDAASDGADEDAGDGATE